MFDTTKIILKNNSRDIFSKIKESPILYGFFSFLMIISILVFAFLTYFILTFETKINIKIEDVFFMVVFSFFVKSAYDFYRYYINSQELKYALSTHIDQKKTVSEVFLSVFTTNLFVWFVFSILYLVFLSAFKIDVYDPVLYLIFNLGIIVSICLGCTISINFFSPKRIRLIPTIILILFYLITRDPLYVVLTLPVAILHIIWSIKNSINSYQYIRRKERTRDRNQIKIRSRIKAIFNREITILWRDRLIFSFIFTSAGAGFGSGYLYLYGDEIFIPESLQNFYGDFLPSLFIFMGVMIVVTYTSVFPALNLFLNEEKTLWIIRHIPIKNDTLIYGKTSALILCFITSIPFIAYISIFIGIEHIFFVIWFLIFSYIAGAIISIPLGVKYVGKKSDIMLLYSVTMILFVVLGIFSTISTMILQNNPYALPIMLFIIFTELFVLFICLKISSKMLELKYPSTA